MRCVVDIRDPDPRVVAALANLHLEAVVAQNRVLMRRNPGRIPRLYESGVRFRNEPWAGRMRLAGGRVIPGIEEFAAIPTLLERGWADCAQLCPWRVAELREDGRAAGMTERDVCDRRLGWTLYIYCRQSDYPIRKRLFHVQVKHPDGSTPLIEDPSRFLEF